MNQQGHPTPYNDVNEVLIHFQEKIKDLLESHFLGMYVLGSLALGDFDPHRSDIDFVVVTDNDISDDHFIGLKRIHADFASSRSPWAIKVEAVYITANALQGCAPTSFKYPQIEKGTELFRDVLESGWVFQCYTLREHGVVVSGPDPRTLVAPVDPQEMQLAVEAIAGSWLEQAHHDPTWLHWLEKRENQVFVIQTLCRMLYSLQTGSVTSKPEATRWAQQELDHPWDLLIIRSLAEQYGNEKISQRDMDETVYFIEYTIDQTHA